MPPSDVQNVTEENLLASTKFDELLLNKKQFSASFRVDLVTVNIADSQAKGGTPIASV